MSTVTHNPIGAAAIAFTAAERSGRVASLEDKLREAIRAYHGAKTNVTKTILIHFENPPLPLRCYDYVAMFEGEEECRKYGYGETPQVALQDLIDMSEDDLLCE